MMSGNNPRTAFGQPGSVPNPFAPSPGNSNAITGPELVAALTHTAQVTAASGHRHLQLATPTLNAHKTPLTANQGTPDAVLEKLKAFSAELGELGIKEKDQPLLEELVAYLSKPVPASEPGSGPNPKVYKLLARMIGTWPTRALFPPLYLLRLLVLRPITHRECFAASLDRADDHPIMDILEKFCSASPDACKDASSPVQLMAICVATNMFVTPNGSHYMVSPVCLETVVEAVGWALAHANATIRVTGAALAYNISLNSPKTLLGDALVQCLLGVVSSLESEQDEETARRLLLALGHFLHCNDAAVEMVRGLGFNPNAIRVATPTVRSLALEVSRLL
eukprot:gnl/Hemi2/20293_TR6729_c0_g1_i1.p1 gnl/Hemi2/20293_TR6729_c0_g1~~gnl/Hemi2/20293_TR6729_c0_g1_i1.p1  ORF type:complete len:337 (+),score=53.45 gnl/Hemi2/20293_TR6729_c0_g1_i1:539-1549(+)